MGLQPSGKQDWITRGGKSMNESYPHGFESRNQVSLLPKGEEAKWGPVKTIATSVPDLWLTLRSAKTAALNSISNAGTKCIFKLVLHYIPYWCKK
jgi:hypothetical protein